MGILVVYLSSSNRIISNIFQIVIVTRHIHPSLISTWISDGVKVAGLSSGSVFPWIISLNLFVSLSCSSCWWYCKNCSKALVFSSSDKSSNVPWTVFLLPGSVDPVWVIPDLMDSSCLQNILRIKKRRNLCGKFYTPPPPPPCEWCNFGMFFVVSFFPCLGFPRLWTSSVRPTQKGLLPFTCVGLISHTFIGTYCILW